MARKRSKTALRFEVSFEIDAGNVNQTVLCTLIRGKMKEMTELAGTYGHMVGESVRVRCTKKVVTSEYT